MQSQRYKTCLNVQVYLYSTQYPAQPVIDTLKQDEKVSSLQTLQASLLVIILHLGRCPKTNDSCRVDARLANRKTAVALSIRSYIAKKSTKCKFHWMNPTS